MAIEKCEVTRCGLCRFFSHEGRRGGSCNQLSVTVGAQWTACSLAVSPFTTKPKSVLGIADWAPVAVTREAVAPVSRSSKSIPSLSTVAAVSTTTLQRVSNSNTACIDHNY